MKLHEVEVKSARGRKERVLLATINVPEFETLDEAINNPDHGLGEAKVLELVNTQLKTNLMNKTRGEKTGLPSTKYLRGQAFSELMQEGEIQKLAGDIDSINALVDKRVEELKAKAKAAAPPVEVDEDEEEGEEEES